MYCSVPRLETVGCSVEQRANQNSKTLNPENQRSRYITSSVATCQFSYNICCITQSRCAIFWRAMQGSSKISDSQPDRAAPEIKIDGMEIRLIRLPLIEPF